jgi:hypothetical protein
MAGRKALPPGQLKQHHTIYTTVDTWDDVEAIALERAGNGKPQPSGQVAVALLERGIRAPDVVRKVAMEVLTEIYGDTPAKAKPHVDRIVAALL